jgi:hypothetical protein
VLGVTRHAPLIQRTGGAMKASVGALFALLLGATVALAQPAAGDTLRIYLVDVEGGGATLFVPRPASRC